MCAWSASRQRAAPGEPEPAARCLARTAFESPLGRVVVASRLDARAPSVNLELSILPSGTGVCGPVLRGDAPTLELLERVAAAAPRWGANALEVDLAIEAEPAPLVQRGFAVQGRWVECRMPLRRGDWRHEPALGLRTLVPGADPEFDRVFLEAYGDAEPASVIADRLAALHLAGVADPEDRWTWLVSDGPHPVGVLALAVGPRGEGQFVHIAVLRGQRARWVNRLVPGALAFLADAGCAHMEAPVRAANEASLALNRRHGALPVRAWLTLRRELGGAGGGAR